LEITGRRPATRSCGGGGRTHGEKAESGNERGEEDVQEEAELTLMLDVCSAKAGEAEVRRNRRRTPPESEKGTTNWRRIEDPRVDSLQQEMEEIVVVLLVALAW
jgi:hypothetical protein